MTTSSNVYLAWVCDPNSCDDQQLIGVYDSRLAAEHACQYHHDHAPPKQRAPLTFNGYVDEVSWRAVTQERYVEYLIFEELPEGDSMYDHDVSQDSTTFALVSKTDESA